MSLPPALPPAAMRAEAQRVYGEDPHGYDAGRPDYPERVFDLLVTRCGLGPGSRVLEIGPGTGRVTSRLVAAGARVVAVEPDEALAEHLAKTMDPAAVTVIHGTFEEATLIDGTFDLVVAAMAFHWVDQEVGLPRLHRLLRPGGWVALWWTLFGDPSRPDPFRDATRHLLMPTGPTAPPSDRPSFEIDTDAWIRALSVGAGLVAVGAELIPWTTRFDAAQVRAFHASLISVRRRPADEQQALLDELERMAADEFGSVVERPFVTAVYTGMRAG